MIPTKIQALFDFIEFLDNNKKEYIEKYIPLCLELESLDEQRQKLKPSRNYKDKQEYDKIQKTIKDKFEPITTNIHTPILNFLREKEIWNGDDVFASILNNNIGVISEFTRNFDSEDVEQVFRYKRMYLTFRYETKTDFLGLSFVFSNLDEVLKELFNFFKDTNVNEFEDFEKKTLEVDSILEALISFNENRKENVKFSIPIDSVIGNPKEYQIQNNPMYIKNEFNMGDKIQVGDISDNSGQITIGKEIKNIENNNQIYSIKGNINQTDKSDELSRKSFNWQKWGIIIGTILATIGITVTIVIATMTK